MAATELEGTVALVTGASSGIGEATARALAGAGAAVALVARRAERLEKLGGEIADRKRFEGMEILRAEDIADVIAYVVTRPRHMAVNEVLVRPTQQEA